MRRENCTEIPDLNHLLEHLSEAAVIMLAQPDLEDDLETHQALVAHGIEYVLAARIVEFLPMAYAHVLLAKSGVRLSNSFRRILADGSVSEPRPLLAEPVWQAALYFARTEVERGVSTSQFMALAMRSAEFNAVNQLLHRGSKLENLAATPPLLPWPESGPKQI